MATAFATPNYSGFGSTSTGYGSSIIPGSAAPGTPVDTSPDYGLYSNGTVISRKTGKPWNGVEPRTGKKYANGSEVPNAQSAMGVKVPYSNEVVNPNSAQRYQPIDIVKDPAIANQTTGLLDSFQKATADSLKGFDDYLTQFKSDTSAALDKSKAAMNIQPAIGQLTTDQQQYQAKLDASNQAQKAALDKSAADYATLNAGNAATQRGIVQKGYDELPAYDAAGNAIADRQMQEVIKNLSRYKLGTGVPTGLGTEESRILAQGAADVMLPLKQAQIAKRYDLYGNEANTERGIYGTEQNRVASFNPEIAAREFAANQGTAMQEFQSGQATTQTIQSLKERIANMSLQQAIQFFNLVGVPAQIRQQILGGQISQLGQLGQLNDQSRYRALQDKLGVIPSQPQGYNFSAPNYSVPGRPDQSPPYVPSPGRSPTAFPTTRTATADYNFGYSGESDYVPSRYNPSRGGLDLGPGNQFFRTVINPETGSPMSVPIGGNVNLPNNYGFGRTPEEQQQYAQAQSLFE